MGACAGKKTPKPSITPTVSTETGGMDTEPNPFAKSDREDVAVLRKQLEVSEGRMNRRVKSCYQCVIDKESDQVTELNLKFVNLGPEGMLQLSSVLPFYSNLTSLRLWKTRFGKEGAGYLGRALLRIPNLRLLSIEDNDVGPAGLGRLAEGLRSLVGLEELYIHLNRLGPDGGVVLSSVVGTYRKLKSLTVDENSLEDHAAEALIRNLLKSAKSLKLIGLSFNKLNDAAGNCLLKHIREFTELKRVALNGNNISEMVRDSFLSDGPQIAFDF